jgi:hypothetical protein
MALSESLLLDAFSRVYAPAENVLNEVKAKLNGSVSGFPVIRYVSGDQLRGSLGAYDSKLNTIFINSDAFSADAESVYRDFVLAHEVGHFFESMLDRGLDLHELTNQYAQEVIGYTPDFSLYAFNLDNQTADSESIGFDTPFHSGMAFAALKQLGVKDSVIAGNPNQKISGSTAALSFSNAFKTSNVTADTINNSEGEIYAGNWDADRYHYNDLKPGIAGIIPILGDFTRFLNESIKKKVGISAFGLQEDTASHFDANDFPGGFNVQALRRQDGIKKFFQLDLPAVGSRNDNNTYDALAHPQFKGENAGVQNFLYRYGQVLHAMQDFYSHSNFVNLAYVDNGKWGLQDKIIDDSWGFGETWKRGDVFAGRVVFAKEGPVTYRGLGTSKNLDIYKDEKIYWRIPADNNSLGPEDPGKNEAWGETDTGLIAGIMSGHLNTLYYDTPPSSSLVRLGMPGVKLYAKGAANYGPYSGFSHGGPAGAKNGREWSWAADLAKDHADNVGDLIRRYSSARFTEKTKLDQFLSNSANAQLFAIKQSIHEWDRMAVKLYDYWQYEEPKAKGSTPRGREALQKLAAYAIDSSKQQDFVDRVINLSSAIRANKDIAPYLSSIKMPSYNPAGVENSDTSQWIKYFSLSDPADFNSVNDASVANESSSADEDPLTRRIELFTRSHNGALDRAELTAINESRFLFDQIYSTEQGTWQTLDQLIHRHTEEDDFSSFGVVESHDYLADGYRAIWKQELGNGVIYFVDKENADKTVLVSGFDVGIDSLAIFDNSSMTYQVIDGLTRASFAEDKDLILSRYNIAVNARHENKRSAHDLVLFSDKIEVAIQAEGFYSIDASSLMFDYDTNGDEQDEINSLQFIDYLAEYDWLELINGKLVIGSLSRLPKVGEFDVLAPISDGFHVDYTNTIKLVINPALKLSGTQIELDASTSLVFSSVYQDSSAWSIGYRLIDEAGLPISEVYQLFGRMGASSGVAEGFNDSIGTFGFDQLSRSGSIEFVFSRVDAGLEKSLSVSPRSADTFELLDGDRVIAEVSITSASSIRAEFSVDGLHITEQLTEKGLVMGFALPTNPNWGADQLTGYRVAGELFGEASNSNSIHFLVVDSISGMFVNPETGMILSTPSDLQDGDYVDAMNTYYSENTLFSEQIQRGRSAKFSFEFQVDNSLLSERYVLMPFLRSSNSAGTYVYTSGIAHAGLNGHALKVGNAIGFEDTMGLGDADFDDAMVMLTGFEVI